MDGFRSVKRFYLTEHRGNKRVWLEGQALVSRIVLRYPVFMERVLLGGKPLTDPRD